MADLNRPAPSPDFLEEPKKLPDMLNVLTILTFVGCGLGFIGSFWSFASSKKSYDTLVEAQGRLDQMPEFAKKFMGPEMVEIARKTFENRIPILLLTLVSLSLCLYGAIQMRQLKKSGYTIYAIGEILPIVTSAIFISAGSAFSGLTAIFGSIFIVLFLVLYATQLKYLR